MTSDHLDSRPSKGAGTVPCGLEEHFQPRALLAALARATRGPDLLDADDTVTCDPRGEVGVSCAGGRAGRLSRGGSAGRSGEVGDRFIGNAARRCAAHRRAGVLRRATVSPASRSTSADRDLSMRFGPGGRDRLPEGMDSLTLRSGRARWRAASRRGSAATCRAVSHAADALPLSGPAHRNRRRARVEAVRRDHGISWRLRVRPRARAGRLNVGVAVQSRERSRRGRASSASYFWPRAHQRDPERRRGACGGRRPARSGRRAVHRSARGMGATVRRRHLDEASARGRKLSAPMRHSPHPGCAMTAAMLALFAEGTSALATSHGA